MGLDPIGVFACQLRAGATTCRQTQKIVVGNTAKNNKFIVFGTWAVVFDYSSVQEQIHSLPLPHPRDDEDSCAEILPNICVSLACSWLLQKCQNQTFLHSKISNYCLVRYLHVFCRFYCTTCCVCGWSELSALLQGELLWLVVTNVPLLFSEKSKSDISYYNNSKNVPKQSNWLLYYIYVLFVLW